MSEYQYYEFQAIDRRLTPAEMQKLRTYSTRAQITPTSFVNEYNWGDFKGDADAWMERYFDAFLYFANWGTRILKLRLPARLVDLECVRAYLSGDGSTVHRKGAYLVVTFESECDDDDTYDLEATGLLASMISLRTELARGDQRALYLAWLASMGDGHLDDDAIEPPVPAGLGELTGSLSALADFIRVDPHLLEVAAQASAPRDTVPLQRDAVRTWVGTLAPDEKDDILTRLVVAPDDVASVSAELQRRFGKARDTGQPVSSRSHVSRRTIGELRRATEERTAHREQEAARKAAEAKAQQERESAAARTQHLDRLAGHEAQLWIEIERLVATRLPKSYDQMMTHLVNLRDLADRKGRDGSTDFTTRLKQFRATHARKPSLLERLAGAGF